MPFFALVLGQMKFPFTVSSFFYVYFFPLISGHTQAIESFVSESMEALVTRPESMEEIGAASVKYSQIVARKPEVRHTYT